MQKRNEQYLSRAEYWWARVKVAPPPHPSSEIIGRQAHGIDCLTLTAVSQPTGGKGYHPFTLPHPSHYTTLDSQNISLSTLYFLNLILSNLNSLSKPELGTRQCPRVNCWLLSVSLHQQVIFFIGSNCPPFQWCTDIFHSIPKFFG